LNKIYKSKNKKFDNVKPPSGEVVSKEGFIRYQDWHLFYRGYYVEYLFYLLKLVRKLGLDIPVFHNLPGWIDGKAAEYPVNVIMYDKLIDKTSEIMLGVDHIPEFVDFRNLSDDYICNEITQTVQKRKFPSFGIEVQSGSRHHRTRVYCNDLELFYKACLVHGLKGMNLYMFSQGINPNKKGSLGKTFYWQTPLDVKGNKSKYYNVVEKMGKLIDVHGENLIKTHRKAQTAVGIYRPYYYTEFTIPAFGNRKMNVYDIGLDYDPQQIRNMILYDGVMRALKVLSHDFNLEDLQHINLGDLLKYKQLWVVSLDYMDEKTQKKLALYVKKGGHLIIMPTLPDKDLNLKRCNFLYQEFKVERKEVVFPDFPKMDIYDVKDFSCLNRINIYDNKDSEIIARTSDDKCCGINKKIDKGKLSLLGTGFTYELSEHLEAFRKLLNTDNFRKDVISSNDQLITGLLYGKDYNYLYLLNYHRDSQQVYLKLNSNKDNNNKIRIPHIGKMEVPSTYGLIIPINLTLSKDIRLRYTTSEILTVDSRKNQLRLEIDGAAQIPGQMQFLSQKKVKNVTIDGKKIKISKKDGYNFIFYRHLDKTRHLNIRLS
jgi:beta-galactosidase